MRKRKSPPKEVAKWVELWNHTLTSSYLNTRTTETNGIIKIAAKICLLPESEQRKLFWSLTLLLIERKRRKYTNKVADALPADPESLMFVSRSIRAYEKLAKDGKVQSFKKGKYNPHTVIETMLRVGPSWKSYLKFYRDHFYTYPAVIFSERGIDEASEKLRGLKGEYAKENSGYGKEIEEALETYEA